PRLAVAAGRLRGDREAHHGIGAGLGHEAVHRVVAIDRDGRAIPAEDLVAVAAQLGLERASHRAAQAGHEDLHARRIRAAWVARHAAVQAGERIRAAPGSGVAAPEAMPEPALEPSSRWMRPIWRGRRIAIPLGTALAVVAGIAVDRAIQRDAVVRPIVI